MGDMRRLPIVLALVLGLACVAPAHAATASTRKPAATWKPVVPFIEDDFGRALALAKERKLPVFIEGWAPW